MNADSLTYYGELDSMSLLPALGVDVPEAVSLRRDGELSIIGVADGTALDEQTLVEVTAALQHEGSVAVIAADAAT